jgi:hypothetical protein
MINKLYDEFTKLPLSEKEKVCNVINLLLWVPILFILYNVGSFLFGLFHAAVCSI